MAIRTRTIGRVHAVNETIEMFYALINIVRIGAVRRIEFCGDGKFTTTQHALQTTTRCVTRQFGKR